MSIFDWDTGGDVKSAVTEKNVIEDRINSESLPFLAFLWLTRLSWHNQKCWVFHHIFLLTCHLFDWCFDGEEIKTIILEIYNFESGEKSLSVALFKNLWTTGFWGKGKNWKLPMKNRFTKIARLLDLNFDQTHDSFLCRNVSLNSNKVQELKGFMAISYHGDHKMIRWEICCWKQLSCSGVEEFILGVKMIQIIEKELKLFLFKGKLFSRFVDIFSVISTKYKNFSLTKKNLRPKISSLHLKKALIFLEKSSPFIENPNFFGKTLFSVVEEKTGTCWRVPKIM